MKCCASYHSVYDIFVTNIYIANVNDALKYGLYYLKITVLVILYELLPFFPVLSGLWLILHCFV